MTNKNKFILLLRKGVYPYEDINNWEKLDETTIPPKEDFCSKLNLEGISDADYAHTQKVCIRNKKSRRISRLVCSK